MPAYRLQCFDDDAITQDDLRALQAIFKISRVDSVLVYFFVPSKGLGSG